MIGILFSKKTLALVLFIIAAFATYNILFAGEETAADMCKKVADKKFEEIHGRLPDRGDFVDESGIQNDWYPVFESCLDENQK